MLSGNTSYRYWAMRWWEKWSRYMNSVQIRMYWNRIPKGQPNGRNWTAACWRSANLAFWNDFDEISMRITDAGFQRQKSDNGESFQQVYKYQEDNLRASFCSCRRRHGRRRRGERGRERRAAWRRRCLEPRSSRTFESPGTPTPCVRGFLYGGEGKALDLECAPSGSMVDDRYHDGG